MMSCRHTMKASSAPLFMYLYRFFLFLYLPAISLSKPTDTGVVDHSNGEQSSMTGDTPSPSSLSTVSSSNSIDTGVEDRSNGEQSPQQRILNHQIHRYR